ncbi:YopX family protein [Helicobacter sp. MIT 11-5569]|uniref:YopX family protein n=1 Tax=Helicobacter sp. MIT 11-5569 TaxID=1548151 RepID=UPI000B2AE6BD|nr:YopX family protein [Helicobacter sp. MIT 11-5569]
MDYIRNKLKIFKDRTHYIGLDSQIGFSECKETHRGCNEEEFFLFTNQEDYEIELWIGLKDKNGKKIHEGDIVSYEGKIRTIIFNAEYMVYELWEVVEDNGIYNLNGFLEYMHNESIESEDYEIIGNIHENKELLQ